ncbi:type II toxin-antitoxin system death-on-curing family toxin [Leucobacter komagatae]|uniref:type II toxin-antitoxin system death-on-curing family toxin n=1 Tax=Leucobacter komagatae TaxID=55969 RepID=UPI00115250FF|nr:Fic family protein [Leucobacter komagatae]
MAAEFPADTLLGRERGDALEATVATIYQGFAGHELYPTVEEKAANLLYLVVKDHPLADGNKRSATALFVTFLARNGLLNDGFGRPRIGNKALAATTLMIAMSDPGEKDLMIALLVRMLAD